MLKTPKITVQTVDFKENLHDGSRLVVNCIYVQSSCKTRTGEAVQGYLQLNTKNSVRHMNSEAHHNERKVGY